MNDGGSRRVTAALARTLTDPFGAVTLRPGMAAEEVAMALRVVVADATACGGA